MSASLDKPISDEDQYANDSFETENPEYSSDIESSDLDKALNPNIDTIVNQTPKQLLRHSDYWTCESSSEEDDVVLGQTIAEINMDAIEGYDDDDLALTPAARIFHMASGSRSRNIVNGLPTPPTSKDNLTDDDVDDDDDDDLTECEDFEEDIVRAESEMLSSGTERKENFRKYTKLTTIKQKEHKERNGDITYEEDIIIKENVRIGDSYDDISVEDGGEIDVGEPNMIEELGEEEDDYDDIANEITDEDDDDDYINGDFENGEGSGDNTAVPSSEDEDEEVIIQTAQKQVMAITTTNATGGYTTTSYEEGQSETKSLHTDDSMEEFKRQVKLSQRLRCQSEGGGGDFMQQNHQLQQHMKKGRKSNIPVWIGTGIDSGRENSKISTSETSSQSRLRMPNARVPMKKSISEQCSDTETLTPIDSEFYEITEDEITEDIFKQMVENNKIDLNAGGDFSDFLEENTTYSDLNASFDGEPNNYSVEMERLTQSPSKKTIKPKKLKAGERRNLSFSNERLRDIERHNEILLRKILTQKPTYVADEKKKKKDNKFASLPPTTRVSSAEVNRRKQQRQIDLDNQLMKRKLEAISKRKTKPKKA